MGEDFTEIPGYKPGDPNRYALTVPVGTSEVNRIMPRKDAEELLFQMAFVLGYKIDLSS